MFSVDVPKDWLKQYKVVIQEKVDGTNVGVHFEQDYVPVCQKRSGLILQGEHEQYVRFRDWCYENVEALWNALGVKYCLFGEWLLCQHGVVYDELSSYFLAFDVMEKSTGKFLSHDAVTELLNGAVECVPVLASAWNGNVKQLEEMVKKSIFSSSETCEVLQQNGKTNTKTKNLIKTKIFRVFIFVLKVVLRSRNVSNIAERHLLPEDLISPRELHTIRLKIDHFTFFWILLSGGNDKLGIHVTQIIRIIRRNDHRIIQDSLPRQIISFPQKRMHSGPNKECDTSNAKDIDLQIRVQQRKGKKKKKKKKKKITNLFSRLVTLKNNHKIKMTGGQINHL